MATSHLLRTQAKSVLPSTLNAKYVIRLRTLWKCLISPPTVCARPGKYQHRGGPFAITEVRQNADTAANLDVPAGPLRHRIRDQPVDEPVTRSRAGARVPPVAATPRHPA